MRFKAIKYTREHRKAFRLLEWEVFGKLSFKWLFHDLDKVILFLLLGVKNTSKLHRYLSRHHVNSFWPKSFQDKKSMYLDWESARFTKDDKPLNALEAAEKYYPAYIRCIKKYITEYDTTKIASKVKVLSKPKFEEAS